MANQTQERRKHKRAFFTLEDRIPITVIKRGLHAKTIAGTLLDVSEGGIGFMAKRHEISGLEVGNRLNVFCACLPSPACGIKDVEVEIKYIIDFDQFAQVSVGCRFVKISSETSESIGNLVESRSKILEKKK